MGVEQGGTLAARLLREEIAADPAVKARLVAAYLIETVVPADEYGPGSAVVPACAARDQAGCLFAWMSVGRGDFGRALRIFHRAVVWNNRGHLVGLAGRAPLCVNPLLGVVSDADAPPRLNLGAANATGLEWGARPGFMARQVGAQCVDGILRVTRPRSASLRPIRRLGGAAKSPRIQSLLRRSRGGRAEARRRLFTAARARAPVP